MSEETKASKPSLFGMITSPVQQFERIRGRPLIWGAVVMVIILTAIGLWLEGIGVDAPDLEGVEEDTVADSTVFIIITSIITSIFMVLLGVLVTSAIHILIAKIALSTVSFKQLFSMNTYIWIITALGTILNGMVAVAIGSDPGVFSTSIGSVIQTEGAIAGFWNNIEVFSIWSSIVTAFGLQVVAGFSKKLAWTIVIVFFVVGIIFAMGGSAISGMGGV